ncbi:MAG: hypothetical protein OWU32_01135 [Firmicutes bacterium]|nr:hypothetical protein [Bacillota bacterium]
MKISTLLRAGSLAMDIYNHQSARQLGNLVKGGIERRRSTPEAAKVGTAHRSSKATTQTRARTSGPYRQQGGRSLPTGYPSSSFHQELSDPLVPIKKAFKHVTPDNVQKAMQWHGIIKSFLAKD